MADSQIGGALPAQMPPAVGKGDKAIARSTSKALIAAMKTTKDPQLKATFSQALASLNQHLAQDTKADKKGQARKVSSTSGPKPRKK